MARPPIGAPTHIPDPFGIAAHEQAHQQGKRFIHQAKFIYPPPDYRYPPPDNAWADYQGSSHYYHHQHCQQRQQEQTDQQQPHQQH